MTTTKLFPDMREKTYQVWAYISECEDGQPIDDVGDEYCMGTWPTQETAEDARIQMIDVVGLRLICQDILDNGLTTELRKAIHDILADGRANP